VAQLPLLMVFEISYIVFLLLSMNKWRLHRVTFKIWFSIFFSAFRICLQILLIVQQNEGMAGTGGAVEDQLELMIAMVITFYMLTFYFATIWGILYEVIELLKPKN